MRDGLRVPSSQDRNTVQRTAGAAEAICATGRLKTAQELMQNLVRVLLAA